MVAVTEKLYTMEEFCALPEEATTGCELIDGRIVKKHVWDGEERGMTRDMANHMRVVRLTWRPLIPPQYKAEWGRPTLNLPYALELTVADLVARMSQ